jgi:TPR repeat protein
MKGWLLLNTATQKRGKLFNGPNWPENRDEGIRLLEKAADRSILAKYVLADTYFSNRIGVGMHRDLAKKYMKEAADQDFGNAGAMFAERFGPR